MEDLAAALAYDPTARRRRWAAACALFLFFATVLVVRQGTQAAPMCRGAERKLAGIWDSERREASRRAFLAVDQPFAINAWRYAEAKLDRYSKSWVGIHVETCEATLRGEQSESLLDLRMACLGQRLEEARVLSDAFMTADEDAVVRSASMLSSLSSLEPCSDVESLAAVVPPPRDEIAQKRIDQLRTRVTRARIMVRLGRASASLPLLETASEEARRLNYAPLVAEATLHLAEAYGRLGRIELMEDFLYEALEAALAGHDERTVAWVWLDFVIVGWMRGDFAQAERWAKLARASIETLGDPQLEAHRMHRVGMLHNRQGRYDEAIESFRTALELKRRVYPPDDPRIGYSIHNMGISYRRLGRYEEALEKYREHMKILESAYGSVHPDVAGVLGNIALAHRHMGEPSRALAFSERSIAIYERVAGPDHFELAGPLEALGEIRLDLGEPVKAMTALERSLALRTRHGLDPIDEASTRFNLARALLAGPKTDGSAAARAGRLAREARRIYAESGLRAQDDLGRVESWLAEHGLSI